MRAASITENLPLNLEEIVLSNNKDALIGVIGEPKISELNMTSVFKLSNELDRLQKCFSDVKVFYRFGPITLTNENHHLSNKL